MSAAWPAVRQVIAEPPVLRTWLLGARRAQIALGLTLALGLFVVPPIRDSVVDAVFPAERSRGGFFRRARVREHPFASTARTLVTIVYWLGGLGGTGALLVLHAPVVLRSRREEAKSDDAALDRTMAAPSATAAPSAASATADTMAPTSKASVVTSSAARDVERYRIERELGRGGMGVVHLARDTILDRDVALKELPRVLLRDAGLAERFRTEARVLAKLTHPGIVQVFDLVENDDGMWMAMELVSGGSLDAHLEERGALPLDEVSRMGAAMADALAYAHERGVVHRDFKPHNVLVGEDGQLKITDFGLAKIAREGPKLTQAGAILGSPAYMSPEQAAGRESDQRADVYALGVTLYQLIAGRCPFDGDTMSVLAAHITQPPPMAELDVPPSFRDLLEAMLAKDPEARPSNLADVAQRLRAMG